MGLTGSSVVVRACTGELSYPIRDSRARGEVTSLRDPIAVRVLSCTRAALLCGTASAACLIGSAHSTLAQGVTTQFTVGGQVTAPRTFKLSDLQALTPVVTENVSFLAGTSTTNATFTGVSMFNLLNNVVGIRIAPGVN